MAALIAKRARPSYFGVTASAEDQGALSSLSETTVEEEEVDMEMQMEEELAAHSLMMLAHAHSHSHGKHLPSPPAAASPFDAKPSTTVRFVLPNKRKIKKPKEFDDGDADSPYVFQFDVVKREGEKRYKCKTCSKEFLSFQALGGHRASCHKSKSLHNGSLEQEFVSLHSSASSVDAKQNENQKNKIHKCLVCYRVFTSGQALGGHKRSHSTPPAPPLKTSTSVSITKHESERKHTATPSPQRPAKAERQLDLNMPAPLEDQSRHYDCLQLEDSALPCTMMNTTKSPRYNHNLGHYWWMESSRKRVSSACDAHHEVVAAEEAERKVVLGRDLGLKPDLFLVAPLN